MRLRRSSPAKRSALVPSGDAQSQEPRSSGNRQSDGSSVTAARTEPPIAQDGLIARDSGPWAKTKLARLEDYSAIVTKALQKSPWNGLAFVDLMAGPGVCIDSRSGDEFIGSTLRALSTEHPFDTVVSIDLDADNVAALRSRVERHDRRESSIIECLDCNSEAAIELIEKHAAGKLTIMFIDLLGTEVSMATIKRLTNRKGVDLMITWPEMDIVRNRGLMMVQASRWTRFFGTDEWRDVAATGPVMRLKRFQDLYVRQLEKLGYAAVFDAPVKNTKGGRIYRPLFATRHPLGVKFWNVSAPKATQLNLLS